jgi:hypothetical protein
MRAAAVLILRRSLFQGPKWADRVSAGRQLTVIHTLQSGLPVNIGIVDLSRLAGASLSRASIVRTGLSLDRILLRTVTDSNCPLEFRCLAARLLRDVGGTTSAFVPLLSELISAGDAKATWAQLHV